MGGYDPSKRETNWEKVAKFEYEVDKISPPLSPSPAHAFPFKQKDDAGYTKATIALEFSGFQVFV